MARYRVLTQLMMYPTDPVIIKRLLGGDQLTSEERGDVTHLRGEVVDDIPECSVASLLAEGSIELVVSDTPVVAAVEEED